MKLIFQYLLKHLDELEHEKSLAAELMEKEYSYIIGACQVVQA